jgi:surface antigen
VPPALRVIAFLSCLVLVSGLGVGVTALPASATITRLCVGYDACREAGMPHAGYKAASGTAYWRMYPGHNCTNYAAYRMVQSGLPNIRPWDGGGNAMYWGQYKASITDATPRVGAVAWWKANVPGAGSVGHVAYVEKVVSADAIIVSQDSWGGEFSWARITRSSTGWPSGFIHFNDVPLHNTSRPTISGQPRVNEVLTASTGTWSPTPGRYRYQWLADGVDIAGATSSSLTPSAEQEGKRISVRITASKLGYPITSATSTRTEPVAPAVLTNLSRPTIGGEPIVDSTLTAFQGTWKPGRVRAAYQWLADGVPVDGATDAMFRPRPEDVGRVLTVQVTASKPDYRSVTVESEGTAPVAPGTIELGSQPTVSGVPLPGEVLRVETGSVTPASAAPAIEWLRSGVPVEGAVGQAYPVTAEDLGSRIAARVTWTKPGYSTVWSRSSATRRVKAVPVMRIRTERPAPRRLRITVIVRAPGVTPVTGSVRIRALRSTIGPLTLRNGTAATTLRRLEEGDLPFGVRYSGSDKVFKAEDARTVRIRY